jgi:hypothetical protein
MSYWQRHRGPIIFLLTVLFVCEILVDPLGEFPLNDDWAYAQAVLRLTHGIVDIGTWPAMSLLSHMLWGFLFVKVFGFSFVVLRMSTLVSACITMLVLYDTIYKRSHSRQVSVVATLVLLLNPLFFNMSNTFMTDVNFNLLFLLTTITSLRFIEEPGGMKFVWCFLCALLLVFLRQFGIVAPLCLTFTCLLLKNNRWRWFIISAACTILILTLLSLYEQYLRTILPPTASYRYLGQKYLYEADDSVKLLQRSEVRFREILVCAFIYISPVCMLHLHKIRKERSLRSIIIMSICSLLLVIHFFDCTNPIIGNILNNLSLGPSTFYTDWVGGIENSVHTYSGTFKELANVFKYVFCFFTFLSIINAIVALWYKRRQAKFSAPDLLMWLMIVMYAATLFVSDFLFDRYLIPVITLGILITTRGTSLRVNIVSALSVLLFAFVSVCGTHDYMVINKIRWEAGDYLVKEKKAHPDKVNGGFEMAAWSYTRPYRLFFDRIGDFDYVIQYQEEPRFKTIRLYTFKRWLSMKPDTIRVSERLY